MASTIVTSSNTATPPPSIRRSRRLNVHAAHIDRVNTHSVNDLIIRLNELKIFLVSHIGEIWDFMSLQSLQLDLTETYQALADSLDRYLFAIDEGQALTQHIQKRGEGDKKK